MYMPYTKNPHMPKVRMEAVLLFYEGWTVRRVALHFGVSPGTISKWSKKKPVYGKYGRLVIPTESSRPPHHPYELSKDIIDKIIKIREKNGRCAEVIHKEMLNQGCSVSLSSVKR